MILTVHLPDDVALRLRERASRGGKAIEEYVAHLIERDAAAIGPTTAELAVVSERSSPQPGQDAVLSDDEFDGLLSELATGPAWPPPTRRFLAGRHLLRPRLMLVIFVRGQEADAEPVAVNRIFA